MKVVEYPPIEDWKELFKRPKLDQTSLRKMIADVFELVSNKGDEALKDYTQQFDKVALDSLFLNKDTLEKLASETPETLVEALKVAYKNIHSFHSSQVDAIEKIETQPGVTCWRKSTAIDSVGLYIPGGSAPLFSTLLMLAIPAQIAGCREIIVCTPPQQSGHIIHPAIAWVALQCGIEKIYTVGGAQAIAAMSLGTPTIPECHKIFGPGNQYVTAAKEYAQEFYTAIDMPAGPSEVMVVADDSANAAFVASDLLSQAEHGPDSQVILVTDSKEVLLAVQKEVQLQLDQLPRKEIAQKALENSKYILTEAENFSGMINTYAPEHLILQMDATDRLIQEIRNAGSVFIGHFTPESAGDYASGTNHTLPTDSYANMYSGVSVDSFVKKITFQEITKEGISRLGPSIETMAQYEQLHAHKNAVNLRLMEIKSKKKQ